MTIQDPQAGSIGGGYEEAGPTLPINTSPAARKAVATNAAGDYKRDPRNEIWTPRSFTQTALNIFSRDMSPEDRAAAMTEGLSALTAIEYGNPNAEIRNWANSLKRSIVREQLRKTGKLDELREAFEEADAKVMAVEDSLRARPAHGAASGDVEGGAAAFDRPDQIQANLAELRAERDSYLNQLRYVEGRGLQSINRETHAVDRFLSAATGGTLGDRGGNREFVATHDSSGKYYVVPDTIADHDLSFGAEGLDRLTRTSLLLGPRKETDDERVVIDAGGTEYDLTEQVREFSTPEVKNSLRRVMAGIDDRAFIPAISQAGSLSMGAVETIGNKFLPDGVSNGYWWNTYTAHPDIRLRYLPKLYKDDESGFRSWQALQDPAKFRAVMEVMGQMQEDGELGKSFWEQAGGMSVSMAEFIGLSTFVEGAAAKAGAKHLTAKAASRAGSFAAKFPAVPWAANTGRVMLEAMGFGSKIPYWRGVQFTGRNVLEEVMYGVAQGIFDPNVTMREGALGGAGEGVAEAGISMGSGLARRTAARMILPALRENHWARRMAESRTMARDYNYQFSQILNLPSGRADLRERVKSVFTDGRRADAIAKTFDALAVGWSFGVYEAAVLDLGEKWGTMSATEKAAAMVARYNSPEALGNMALFGGTAGAHYAANAKGWGDTANAMNAYERQAIEDISRAVMQDLSSPDNAKVAAQYAELFDQLVKENPDLAKGLVFRSDIERTSTEERVRYDEQAMSDGFGKKSKDSVRVAQKFVNEFQRSRVSEQDKKEVTYEATGHDDTAATIWLHEDSDEDLAVKRVDVRGQAAYAVVHGSDPARQIEKTKLWEHPWDAMAEVKDVIRRRAEARHEKVDEQRGQERMEFPEGAEAEIAHLEARAKDLEGIKRWRIERKIRTWREFMRKWKPGPDGTGPTPPTSSRQGPQREIRFPGEREWAQQATTVAKQIIDESLAGRTVDAQLAKSILSLLRQVPDSPYTDALANGLETAMKRAGEVRPEVVSPEEAAVVERSGTVDPRQAPKSPGEAIPDQVKRENKDRARKPKPTTQTRRKPQPPAPPAPEVEADPERSTRYKSRPTGREDSIFLAGGKELPIRYRVVEVDDVLPSHDARARFRKNPGADANERPYDDPTEGEPYRRTVEDVATKLKPRLVFNESPSVTDGVPITNEAGVVLGGNARAMGMQLGYSRGGEAAKTLRSEALAFAKKVGIDPASLGDLKNPIVVREIVGEASGARGELSRDLNEPLTTARTAATDAASRGSRVTQQVAKDVGDILELGTLANALNSKSKTTALVGVLVKAGVLSDADVIETKLDTGLLNKSGRDRVEQALLGAAIGDARRIVEMSPSHRNKILRSLPAITRLKGAWPAFMGHLENMLDGAKSLRESKLSINDSLKHVTLQPEAWKQDEVAVALLRRFTVDKELVWAKRMSEVEAKLRDAEIGQSDMFGQSGPTDPWVILSGALEVEGTYAQQDLAQQDDEPDLFTQGEDTPSLEHAITRLGTNDEIAIDLQSDIEAGWAPVIAGTRKQLGELRQALTERGIPFDYLAEQKSRSAKGDNARIQLIEDGVSLDSLSDKGSGVLAGNLADGTTRYIGRSFKSGENEGLRYRPELEAESVPGGVLLSNITLEDARDLLDPQAVQLGDQVRVGNRARARVEYMVTPPGETPGERLQRAIKLERAYTPPDPSGFVRPDSGRYQIDELGAQPRETALARLAQAGATGQRAAMALADAKVAPNDNPHSQETQDAMRAILVEDAGQGSAGIFRAFEERYGGEGLDVVTAKYEEALTAARAHLAFTQLAALQLAAGDAKTDAVLRNYFRAKEDLANDGVISPAVRAELKRANMLGEDGVGLAPAVEGQLAQWMVDARQHALNEEGETFYSADPFMAFGGPRLMDEHGVRLFPDGGRRGTRLAKLLAKSPGWVRKINRGVTKSIGRPALAAGLPSIVRRQNYQAINAVIKPAHAEAAQTIALATQLAGNMVFPNGTPLPASIDKRLTRLIQMNGMKRITTPKQLGQALGDQSYAYLFGPVKRIMEQADAVGADLADLGFLTDEQVQNRRGSYLMRERIRKDDRNMRDRMAGKGRMDLFASRDLPVNAEAENLVALDVLSSSYLHTKGMAQEARIRMMLRLLDGYVERGVAIPYAEFTRKNSRGEPLYDKQTREWYEMAASKYEPTDRAWNPEKGKIGKAVDPINGRSLAGRQTLLHDTLLHIRDQMGNPPEEGEDRVGGHPYIEKMKQRVDDWIGTDEKPGYVLNQIAAAEIEMTLRDMLETAPPVSGPIDALNQGVFGEYLAARMDDLTRYWRRTVTIGSPKHWVLARSSDVLTNWAMDSVGIADFVTSIIFGKGVYADSMRHMLWWQRWHEIGRPDGDVGPNGARLMPEQLRAEGWTEDQWAAVLDVDWHAGYLVGGTFVTTLIESQALGTILGSATRSDDITAKLREEMRQRGMEPGKPGNNLTASFADAITEYGRRVSMGMDAFARKIQQAFDQGDTEHRLKAIADWTAQYQMYELLAKYAASQGLRKKNPMLSREAAAIYGAQGTADYSNTSPHLRRWTTSMNWMRGKDWDKLEKAPGAKRFIRMMTQSPFLLYQSNMQPALLRAATRRPHKVALAMGLQQALRNALRAAQIAGGVALYGAIADDDDEDLRRQQAQAGSYREPGRQFITPQEAEQLATMLTNAPGVGDWINNVPMLKRNAKEMFLGMLAFDTGTVRAPRRTRGELRTTDAARLNPLLETVQSGARAVRDEPVKGTWGTARDLIRTIEGLVPTMGGAAVSGIIELSVPSDGKRRVEVLAKLGLDLAGSMASSFDPTLAPLSREGQLAIQMSALEGQTIDDFVAGYENDYPLSPEDRLAALVFGSMLSTSAVMRKNRYRPEASLVRQVLGQVGINVDTDDDVSREWQRAADMVLRQWLDTAQSTYAMWTDWGAQQGVESQVDLLDKMFADNLLVFEDLDPKAYSAGIYRLREGEPKSSLAKMIARQPDADQARMLRFAAGLARGPGWKGGGKEILKEMARMRQVEPEVFGGLYEATLRDPYGRGLLDYYDKLLLKEGRRDNLAELGPLWLKVPRPGAGDKRRETYEKIDRILFPDARGWPQTQGGGTPAGRFGLGDDPDLIKTGEGAKEFIRRYR